MGIEYFEPRPPKVVALQLQPSWSIGEFLNQLQQVPGVSKVAAERLHDNEVVYTAEPDRGCGKSIRFNGRSGGWIVAVITGTTDVDGYFETCVDVKKLSDHTFQRLFRTVDPEHAASDVSAREAGQRWGKEIQQGLGDAK